MNEWLRPSRPAGPLLVAVVLLAGCILIQRPREGEVIYRQANPAVVFAMLRDSPEMFILDLRTPEEFSGPLGHLYRAVNVPLGWLPDRLAELPSRFVQLSGSQERTFIVCCRRGDDCGHRGMVLLAAKGFKYPVLLAGGVEEWIRRGFGTVGGTGEEIETEGTGEGEGL